MLPTPDPTGSLIGGNLMLRSTTQVLPRARRRLGAAAKVLTTAAVVIGLGLVGTMITPDPAQAQKQTQRLDGDLPELPALDPALNPNVGIGRIADLVRQRVVGMLSLLGSLTEGDIIATEGPITATEMPDGGARVLLEDLTVRAGASSGFPYVLALGDIIVDAADTPSGGVTYRSSVAGPFLVYADGQPLVEFGMASLVMEGEILPETPILGQDTITLEGLRVQGQDAGGDAPIFTADGGRVEGVSGVADDGSLNADLILTLTGVGIAKGDHDPTVKIEEMTATSVYKNVPEAWLSVLEGLAATETLPSLNDVLADVAAAMGGSVLGYNEGSFSLSGLEVFVTPTEALTIDRLGVEAIMDEPSSGPASGRYAFTMDGMRTRGNSLPAAVDLGAMRVSLEGSGVDVARLRGYLADMMQSLAALPLSPDADEPMPETLPAEMEARLLDGAIGLIRDVAIGQAEGTVSLSGLAVRGPMGPLMGLDGLTVQGGWDEGDDGLLDTPATVVLTGLSVSDPDLGMPVRIGRIELDTASRDIDLGALRALMVAAVDSFEGQGVPPSPEVVDPIVESMTVPGGFLTLALQDIVVGTEMNPMGGLKSAELAFEVDSAAPEKEVSDARLSLSVDGLELGTMMAGMAPGTVLPTKAGLVMTASDLPLPAISRLGMAASSDPMMADQVMEQGSMELLTRYTPGLTIQDLSIGAPVYAVEGGGAVSMTEAGPEAVEGTLSMIISGLDDTMTALQDHARTSPMAEQMMQQPLMMLVALRGLGRVTQPGRHVYDIEITADQEITVNGTPLQSMMGPPPGEGAPMPGPTEPAPQ